MAGSGAALAAAQQSGAAGPKNFVIASGNGQRCCARALEMEVIDVTRIERMVERGLSGRAGAAPPPPPPRDNVVPLRFARHPAEYRARRPPPEGGSDAPA